MIDEQDRLLGMHLAGLGNVGLFLPLGRYLSKHGLTLF